MQKKQNIFFKNILFYIVSFIVSMIFIKKIPIGAISIFTCAYSAGFILTPSIIISILAIMLAGNLPYILVYIFYILIFIAITILIKPLVAVHDIYEKLKVEKYLIFTTFYLSIFILNFSEAIYITILNFTLYKFIVNTLPIIKNDKNKIVFSNTEIISFYILLILTFQILCLKLNSIFYIDTASLYAISAIFSSFCIALALFKTNLISSLFCLVIYILSSIIIFNIIPGSFYVLGNFITLNIFSILSKNIYSNKKRLLIYTVLYDICFIILCLMLKNILLLINFIVMNVPMYFFIFNEVKLFDGFIFKSNFIPKSLDKNFSYADDPKFNYRKIYDLNKFNEFKNSYITSNEELLENPIFDEIKLNDDLTKWIYYNIFSTNSFEIKDFIDILKNNNIIIPKDDTTFVNYINDIRKHSENIFHILENKQSL